MKKHLFTTSQAARFIGVSPRRIRAMIRAGILQGQKLGRDWIIKSDDLVLVERKKAGRPKKG